MTDFPTTEDAPPADEREQPTEATGPSVKDRYADWPQKGGNDQPQPWDLKALGIPQPGVDRGPLEPDEPNPAPVVPRAGLPLISSGSQGPEVRDLAVRLGELGYANSISRGSVDNPYAVYDDSVAGAVEGFRRDYDVEEDPSAFIRDSRANALSHVGPWTQEAIIRASDREREATAA
jgi:peptidoglycan hydrolase-like protein with peptidoglycan-binding domain